MDPLIKNTPTFGGGVKNKLTTSQFTINEDFDKFDDNKDSIYSENQHYESEGINRESVNGPTINPFNNISSSHHLYKNFLATVNEIVIESSNEKPILLVKSFSEKIAFKQSPFNSPLHFFNNKSNNEDIIIENKHSHFSGHSNLYEEIIRDSPQKKRNNEILDNLNIKQTDGRYSKNSKNVNFNANSNHSPGFSFSSDNNDFPEKKSKMKNIFNQPIDETTEINKTETENKMMPFVSFTEDTEVKEKLILKDKVSNHWNVS